MKMRMCAFKARLIRVTLYAWPSKHEGRCSQGTKSGVKMNKRKKKAIK